MTPLIGITQRCTSDPKTGERRDALDQAWTTFIQALGFDIVPIPNGLESVGEWVSRRKCDGIILSGGGDTQSVARPDTAMPERDLIEFALLNHCQSFGKPLIGVCRGMQVIHEHFGGTLRACDGHVATDHPITAVSNADAKKWTRHSVNSFHNFRIDQAGLPSQLQPLAISSDGGVEAFCVHGALMWGIMWHPERNKPFVEMDIALFRSIFRGEA